MIVDMIVMEPHPHATPFLTHVDNGDQKVSRPQKVLTEFPYGRVPDAVRPLSINVGSIATADGSSLVRCGDTRVICGVKLELVSSTDSKMGYLVCNVDCGSSCSPGSSSSAPSSQVQALTKQLQLLLEKYIILEHLAMKNSEFVWTVFVDVVCLSHHGNLLDTCTLAAVAALQNTEVPSLSVDLPLSGGRLPLRRPSFTISFALLEEWCLLDATLEEEESSQGSLCFSIRGDGTLTLFQHAGHKITEQEILRLSNLAMNQVSSLNKLLQKAQKI